MLAFTACKKDNTTNNSPTTPVGDWQRTSGGVENHLVFKSDLTYEVGYDDLTTGVHTVSITGTYSYTATQFNFISAVGANSCDSIPGAYSYVKGDNNFKVTTVMDGCTYNGINRSTSIEGDWTKPL